MSSSCSFDCIAAASEPELWAPRWGDRSAAHLPIVTERATLSRMMMMALGDRHYSRGGGGSDWSGGGQPFFYQLLRALNWSFPIGTYVGVQVRVHITFILL